MTNVRRYLVIFRSHPEGEVADITAVDSYGASPLEAIMTAKEVKPPHHPWCSVKAWPWPRGCPGVVEATEKLTAIRR